MIGDEIVFAICDEINEDRDTGVYGSVTARQIGKVKFRPGCAELEVDVTEGDGFDTTITISAAPILTRMLGYMIWESL